MLYIFVVFPILMLIAGAVLAWGGLSAHRRLRRARDVGEGPAGGDGIVTGRTASIGSPLVAPLSGRACVWYEVADELKVGVGKYERARGEASVAPFVVVRDDGAVAEIRPGEVSLFGGRALRVRRTYKDAWTRKHRVTESAIPAGARLTVVAEWVGTQRAFESSDGRSYRVWAQPAAVPVLGGTATQYFGLGDRAALGRRFLGWAALGLALLIPSLGGLGVVAWGVAQAALRDLGW